MMKFCSIARNLKYFGNQKVKRAGFLLSVLLFSNVLSAQAQYFNKRIDFMGFNQPENGFSLEKMNDGNFLVFVGGFSESGDRIIMGRTVVSPQGEILDNYITANEVSHLYTGHSNTSFKLTD